MNNIITNIKSKSAVVIVILSVVLSGFCFCKREAAQFIEPLGLYFRIQHARGEEVRISFGENDDSVYPNYFETAPNGEMCGYPFYYIVDNSSGSPKIRYIFISRQSFFDIHIPDYPYSIEKFSLITDKNDFSAYVEGLPKIERNMRIVDYPDHYVVWVQSSSYDAEMEYWTYSMDGVEDLDSLIDHYVNTPNYLSFLELKENGVALGYQENIAIYGDPIDSKRIIVTKDNRKELMLGGWLFLDTMDIKPGQVLDIEKWKDGDFILSVIYRIDANGEMVSVNGVRYDRRMDIQKWRVYYQ